MLRHTTSGSSNSYVKRQKNIPGSLPYACAIFTYDLWTPRTQAPMEMSERHEARIWGVRWSSGAMGRRWSVVRLIILLLIIVCFILLLHRHDLPIVYYYGGRLVSKLHYCIPFSFGYTFFIWVYLFHLGILISFGYTSFIWVYPFHLGIPLSFGYTFFIWVYLSFGYMYCSSFQLVHVMTFELQVHTGYFIVARRNAASCNVKDG